MLYSVEWLIYNLAALRQLWWWCGTCPLLRCSNPNLIDDIPDPAWPTTRLHRQPLTTHAAHFLQPSPAQTLPTTLP